MRRLVLVLIVAAFVLVLIAAPGAVSGQSKIGHRMTRQARTAQSRTKGILLEELTWLEAEKVLDEKTIVVIPIGAAAKEHGPHLKLKNDWLIAEYLKQRVLEQSNVVVAPTINYHFYPAFLEYPGSTSLRLETARDLIVDVCKSLARYGPRRFYVLNTGVSTLRALKPAADALATDGLLLQYTDLLKITGPVEKAIGKQEGGTHADEIETSMMLYMAPATVNMKKAAKDYHPSAERGLTRDPKKKGIYSPTGIFGDATLATKAKGQKITKALVEGILKEIEALRLSSPTSPVIRTASTPADLSSASENQLQQHLGSTVTMRGKFSLHGKIGPFIVVGGRPIYLRAQGSFSWGSYARMEGKAVSVTGTLRFADYPETLDTALPEGRVPDHFYFEAETAKVELIQE